jgi:hypothetical protein
MEPAENVGKELNHRMKNGIPSLKETMARLALIRKELALLKHSSLEKMGRKGRSARTKSNSQRKWES